MAPLPPVQTPSTKPVPAADWPTPFTSNVVTGEADKNAKLKAFQTARDQADTAALDLNDTTPYGEVSPSAPPFNPLFNAPKVLLFQAVLNERIKQLQGVVNPEWRQRTTEEKTQDADAEAAARAGSAGMPIPQPTNCELIKDAARTQCQLAGMRIVPPWGCGHDGGVVEYKVEWFVEMKKIEVVLLQEINLLTCEIKYLENQLGEVTRGINFCVTEIDKKMTDCGKLQSSNSCGAPKCRTQNCTGCRKKSQKKVVKKTKKVKSKVARAKDSKRVADDRDVRMLPPGRRNMFPGMNPVQQMQPVYGPYGQDNFW